MLTTSLIISTYNRPKALYLTLLSVLQQTTKPTEVIIADDGSQNETLNVVNEFTTKLKIKYIWHADEGFRLAAIRNKAIAASQCNYIIQIDGDLILHKNFIKDHIKFAKPLSFVTGSRVLINSSKTSELENTKSIVINTNADYLSDKGNGMYLPMFVRFFEPYKRYKEPAKVRGCNMAFWKVDFIKVNGYNESFEGWGHEDMELAARFLNIGLKKRYIKFAAIQYHLYHPEASKHNDTSNKEKVFETVEQNKKTIENGVNKYLVNEK